MLCMCRLDRKYGKSWTSRECCLYSLHSPLPSVHSPHKPGHLRWEQRLTILLVHSAKAHSPPSPLYNKSMSVRRRVCSQWPVSMQSRRRLFRVALNGHFALKTLVPALVPLCPPPLCPCTRRCNYCDAVYPGCADKRVKNNCQDVN